MTAPVPVVQAQVPLAIFTPSFLTYPPYIDPEMPISTLSYPISFSHHPESLHCQLLKELCRKVEGILLKKLSSKVQPAQPVLELPAEHFKTASEQGLQQLPIHQISEMLSTSLPSSTSKRQECAKHWRSPYMKPAPMFQGGCNF